MSYLDKQLIKGERVVFLARPHVVMLASRIVGLTVAVLILGAAVAFPILRPLMILSIGIMLWSTPRIARFATTEYIVTNKRLCVRAGVFRVRSFETVLNKVGTIGIEQSIVGRTLGYGTVVIKGLGGSIEALPRINQPHLLRRKIHEALALG